jgi:hypothetical protein
MTTSFPFEPHWERHGPVSQFLIAPGRAVYRVEECRLLGGSLFVASTLDTGELVGQFESEHNARQACARDLAQKRKAAQGQSGAKER